MVSKNQALDAEIHNLCGIDAGDAEDVARRIKTTIYLWGYDGDEMGNITYDITCGKTNGYQ